VCGACVVRARQVIAVTHGKTIMLELRTLGVIDLRSADGAPVESVLLHVKRVALLAYLCAGFPLRQRRRDALVALLWPELDDAHARGALRHELWELRRALGPGVITGDRAEVIGVDPDGLWCDVHAFESALGEGRCRDALRLWNGEFLPGLHVNAGGFDQWLDEERLRLTRGAAGAAHRLGFEAEHAGDIASAIAWARRHAELAPYDEPACQRLLQLLDRAGDRAGALTTYEAFTERLRQDLEVEPSPETRRLLEGIRARSTSVGPAATGGVAMKAHAPDSAAGHAGSVAIALLPVENRTGKASVDPVVRRLNDKLAFGLSNLRYVSLIRGHVPPNAVAVVTTSLDRVRDHLEIRSILTEAGEGGRVLEMPPPIELGDRPEDRELDGVVERVLTAVHAHYDPRIGVGSVRTRWSVPSWEPFQLFARGAESFGALRFREAAEHLRQSWEVDRRYVEAGVFSAIALLHAGDPAAAEALVTSILSADPAAPEHERYFAEWLLADLRGRRPEAYRAIMEAGRLGNHPATWMVAAREALRMNRPREAVQIVARTQPDHGWWRNWTELWEGQGAALHMLGEHDAELSAVLDSRRRFPDSLVMLRAEVRTRAALWEPAEVARLINEAMTLPPGVGPAGNPLYVTPAQVAWVAAQELDCHGLAEQARQARDAAIGWFAGRKERSPSDWMLEARIHLERGDADRAHSILGAMSPDPAPEATGLVGVVAAARGDRTSAAALVDTLERMDQPYINGRNLFAAAGIRVALGELDAAMDTLRRSVAAGMSFGAEWHALPALQPLATRSDFRELLLPRG